MDELGLIGGKKVMKRYVHESNFMQFVPKGLMSQHTLDNNLFQFSNDLQRRDFSSNGQLEAQICCEIG
jgi:hypothetical protein